LIEEGWRSNLPAFFRGKDGLQKGDSVIDLCVLFFGDSRNYNRIADGESVQNKPFGGK